MPALIPVAAGAVVAGAATSAGFALTTAVLLGTAAGAVVGAGLAAAKGESILKGALMGALGGLGGSFAGAALVGAASGAAATGAAGAAPTAGLEMDLAAGYAPSSIAETTAALPTSITAPVVPDTAGATTGVPPTGGKGILGGVGQWMKDNPAATQILGQGVSGAAKSMIDERINQEQLDYLMERDKLNRIRGLGNLTYESAIPKIDKFAEKPSWTLDTAELENMGILQRRM